MSLAAAFRLGTRSSRLALLQAAEAIAQLQLALPETSWTVESFSSPGDRDKAQDLTLAAPDFFTRDLDEALLAGAIDCAVHSAKDLPDTLHPELDFFWLPGSADPQDVIVGSLNPRRVGVSSQRRIDYVAQHFPAAVALPIRGTIEERLARLDTGAYDALIMAAAALQRLGLEERIAARIPPSDLPVPAGQGVLAITFRRSDFRLQQIRSLFLRPVVFVSAGAGRDLCTTAGLAALRQSEICLYDALLDPELLQALPPTATAIFVGKRAGQPSISQDEICRLLCLHARRGARVVRLKGGDAGIYGRLAEEIAALDAARLPWHVIPGVSSLTTATTASGLLLTRRGLSDRFRVLTARHAADNPAPAGESLAVFMVRDSLAEVTSRLVASGLPSTTPAALVLDAAGSREEIVQADLATMVSLAPPPDDRPGLLLAGESMAASFRYRHHGALQGRRVWLTCSRDIQARSAQAVRDFGGIPIREPLIELVAEPVPDLSSYEWIILTSPSAVRCLLSQVGNVRTLPRILCCGVGTAAALALYRLEPDAMPATDFSTAGVLATALETIPAASRICRLRSDRAGGALAERLRQHFAAVDDVVICRNRTRQTTLPRYDAVFLASASAVDSLVEQFGTAALEDREVFVIGPQDADALRHHGVERAIAPRRATVEDAVAAYAAHCVMRMLNSYS